MRDLMTADVLNTIGAPVITTALCARLDFKSEVCFVWTGIGSIQPQGSGDSALDGNTFDALASGVVAIGDNSFTKNGSDELTVTLSIPSTPNAAIAAASVYASEYQARPVVLWRALKIPSTDPLAAPVWSFRRIRSGKMDKVEITNDGTSHQFKLTVESHQANISNASNKTYQDQNKIDPSDTSQDYSTSCANGAPAPITTANNLAGTGYYGGGGSVKFEDGSNINLV